MKRPDSCPAPGVVPAFDAGWKAHEVGLGRETVEALTPAPAQGWTLMGYDVRKRLAEEES